MLSREGAGIRGNLSIVEKALLFPKCFTSIDHSICTLSVSDRYRALDEIDHPFRAAFQSNPSCRKKLLVRSDTNHTGDTHPLWRPIPRDLSQQIIRSIFNKLRLRLRIYESVAGVNYACTLVFSISLTFSLSNSSAPSHTRFVDLFFNPSRLATVPRWIFSDASVPSWVLLEGAEVRLK